MARPANETSITRKFLTENMRRLSSVALAKDGLAGPTIKIIMHYIYLIQSLSHSNKKYIGNTTNLEQRLETHNSGGSLNTKPYRPWELILFIGFKDKLKATAFEKYLKSGSGNAFAKKRLW